MRCLAVVVVVAGLLTACTTTQPPPPALMPGSGGPVSSAPVASAGLDWFLTQDPTETRLAYGQANSGDFRMALICEPGSGRVSLMQVTEATSAFIVLESGGDMERITARSEPAGVQDGNLLLAEAATSIPVFRRFRTLGWLAMWQGDQREMLTAHPESRPSVDRFFTLCG